MITKDIDTGLSTLGRYWTTEDANVLQLAYELQDAECGVLRENKIGQIAFESRAHRPAHTAAYTFGSGGLYMWNLRQEDPLRGIYNQIDVQKRTFNVSDDTILAIISDVKNGQGGTPPTIPTGTSTISIRFPGPGTPSNYLAVASWGTIDVEVYTGIDRTGTDITNSNITLSRAEYADRIDITFVSTYGGNAYATLLRAHGTAVVEGDPVPMSASDATSITNYRKRIYPNPSRWLTDAVEAKDYCDHVLAMRKDPHARVTFEVKANYSAAHLAAVAAIDVSDKIHIHATVATYGLGIDGDFFVEYIRHRVDSGRVHVVEYQCRAAATHNWPASGTPYASKTVPEGVPDDLYTTGIDPDMRIVCGCRAWKYNQNITGARFRAKFYAEELPVGEAADLRTPAEGGDLLHDPGETGVVLDNVIANEFGAQVDFTSLVEGVWYYAFQFKSPAGDSVWSDGNKRPAVVTDHVHTDANGYATGPPSDWTVEVIPDPTGRHAVIVKATRPKVNGAKIWAWVAQVKDISSYSFHPINFDSYGTDTPDVQYGWNNGGGFTDAYPPPADADPAWYTHTLTEDGRRFTRESGTGLTGPHLNDEVHVGDLVLVDVRGGKWDKQYCQWGTVYTVQGVKTGYNIATATYFDIAGRFRPDATTDVRVVVVKGPWYWVNFGYWGDQPNHGLYERWYWDNGESGDTTTEVFISDPIDIRASVSLANVGARVWFDNGYSRSDDDTYATTMFGDTGNPSGASGLTILTPATDSSIPAGQIAFQFNRDTLNYRGIYAVAAILSTALPCEGPYAVERAGHPDEIIETGICTIYAGNKSVTVTRAADANAVGRVFVLTSADGTCDANVIAQEGVNKIILTSPFYKSGDYSYAIVKRWWDIGNDADANQLRYYQFDIPFDIGDREQTVWKTPSVPAPSGNFYATVYSRNRYGVGTRMTAGTASTPMVLTGKGCVELSIVTGHVAVDCSNENRTFYLEASADFTLDNPTGLTYCMQPIAIFIKQTNGGNHAMTLDTKWKLGTTIASATLSTVENKVDVLGGLYFLEDDEIEIVALVKGY